ncbi:unnamed protein product, partial [Amoebophrya sp. A120]
QVGWYHLVVRGKIDRWTLYDSAHADYEKVRNFKKAWRHLWSLGIYGHLLFAFLFQYCDGLLSIPALATFRAYLPNVDDLQFMFHAAELKTVPALETQGHRYGALLDFAEDPAEDFFYTWDVSQITNMESMFDSVTGVIRSPEVSRWDTAKVRNMKRMFANTKLAPWSVVFWDVREVTTFVEMFAQTDHANPCINRWLFRPDADVTDMFKNAVCATPETMKPTAPAIRTAIHNAAAHYQPKLCQGSVPGRGWVIPFGCDEPTRFDLQIGAANTRVRIPLIRDTHYDAMVYWGDDTGGSMLITTGTALADVAFTYNAAGSYPVVIVGASFAQWQTLTPDPLDAVPLADRATTTVPAVTNARARREIRRLEQVEYPYERRKLLRDSRRTRLLGTSGKESTTAAASSRTTSEDVGMLVDNARARRVQEEDTEAATPPDPAYLAFKQALTKIIAIGEIGWVSFEGAFAELDNLQSLDFTDITVSPLHTHGVEYYCFLFKRLCIERTVTFDESVLYENGVRTFTTTLPPGMPRRRNLLDGSTSSSPAGDIGQQADVPSSSTAAATTRDSAASYTTSSTTMSSAPPSTLASTTSTSPRPESPVMLRALQERKHLREEFADAWRERPRNWHPQDPVIKLPWLSGRHESSEGRGTFLEAAGGEESTRTSTLTENLYSAFFGQEDEEDPAIAQPTRTTTIGTTTTPTSSTRASFASKPGQGRQKRRLFTRRELQSTSSGAALVAVFPSVTSMSGSFEGSSTVVLADLNSWNLGEVTSLANVFADALQVTLDTADWNVGKVADFSGAFMNMVVANPNTTAWNTGSGGAFANMFRGTVAATPDVLNWNTGAATDMSGMFQGTVAATPNVTLWNMQSIQTIASMFEASQNAEPNILLWTTPNLQSMRRFIQDAGKAVLLIGPNFRAVGLTNMDLMFANRDIAPRTDHWDVSTVTSMDRMFYNNSLAKPDVGPWDTRRVKNMHKMFMRAPLAEPATSGWNVTQVTDMVRMFAYATNANPDVAAWNTSKLQSMHGMFMHTDRAAPDCTLWNTTGVTDFSQMFDTAKVANPDTEKWNTRKVFNFTRMFAATGLADPNMGRWRMEEAVYLNQMFKGAQAATAHSTWGWQWLYEDIPLSGAALARARTRQLQQDVVETPFTPPPSPMEEFERERAAWLINITDERRHEHRIQFLNNFPVRGTLLPGPSGPQASFTVSHDHRRATSATRGLLGRTLQQDGAGNATDAASSSDAGGDLYSVEQKVNARGIFIPLDYAPTKFGSVRMWSYADEPAPLGCVNSFGCRLYMYGDYQPEPFPTNMRHVYMDEMFKDTIRADPSTKNWYMKYVVSARAMFENSLHANPDTSKWGLDRMTDMSFMFNKARRANPCTLKWSYMPHLRDLRGFLKDAACAAPLYERWDVLRVDWEADGKIDFLYGNQIDEMLGGDVENGTLCFESPDYSNEYQNFPPPAHKGCPEYEKIPYPYLTFLPAFPAILWVQIYFIILCLCTWRRTNIDRISTKPSETTKYIITEVWTPQHWQDTYCNRRKRSLRPHENDDPEDESEGALAGAPKGAGRVDVKAEGEAEGDAAAAVDDRESTGESSSSTSRSSRSSQSKSGDSGGGAAAGPPKVLRPPKSPKRRSVGSDDAMKDKVDSTSAAKSSSSKQKRRSVGSDDAMAGDVHAGPGPPGGGAQDQVGGSSSSSQQPHRRSVGS